MNRKCRFCGKELKTNFVDLGLSPVSTEYLSVDSSLKGEMFYPLHVRVCSECFLVQADVYSSPEKIFNDYKYLSSNSQAWLQHAEAYVDMITGKLALDENSLITEIACNDGYLLQYFNKRGLKNYGVEPAENVADIARGKGIDVECDFFGAELAEKLVQKRGRSDLILGNNVLAHVPDINGFVEGMKILLKPLGTITMEFPHLLNLIKQIQFDTIYHEHFSYFSLYAVINIFKKHGLKIYDVEKLNTHGGSLRIYAAHADNNELNICSRVTDLIEEEKKFGIADIKTYEGFQEKIHTIKYNTLKTLSELVLDGKKIIAYGAAAKGNTFLNYCGLGKEFFECIVDVTPEKQGLKLPGTLIDIVGEDAIEKIRPDYIAVLPWNWKGEITKRLEFTREWGCKLITFIPEINIF